MLCEQLSEPVYHERMCFGILLSAPVRVNNQAGFRYSKPFFLRASMIRSSSILLSTCQPTIILRYRSIQVAR